MSRYFIDTNVFIFLTIERSSGLTHEVIDIISDYSNQICMSSQVVNEVIQLFQQGKIKDSRWKTASDIVDFIKNEAEIEIKYIKEEHLRTLAKLPLFEDHKDPADRMIIAHAINDKIPLISSDRKFKLYQKSGLEFVFNKR